MGRTRKGGKEEEKKRKCETLIKLQQVGGKNGRTNKKNLLPLNPSIKTAEKKT